jgi:hypothetical protein
MEVVAAFGVLLIVMGMTVQMLGWVAAERRAAGRRAWALQEAQNVLERLTVLPPERLRPEAIAALKLDDRVRSVLPGGDLKIEVADAAGGSGSKRIGVAIGWRDRAGAPVPPVRLTTWVEPVRDRKEAR